MSIEILKKNEKKRRIYFLDVLALVVSVSVTIYAFWGLRQKKGAKQELIIQTTEKTYVYDLSKDKIVDIPGDIGVSKIEIHSHSAKFIDSPCPNKTCVHASAIYTSGQWTACLPNQVFIRIEGDDDSSIDVMAQ